MSSLSQGTSLPQSQEDHSLQISAVPSTIRRVGAYALVRILTISATVILGVFIAVIVANKGGGIDRSVSYRLQGQAISEMWERDDLTWEERWALRDQRHQELIADSALSAPFLAKHITWTWNALRLDLGNAIHTSLRVPNKLEDERRNLRLIILDRFPNTLVIVGLADLLVFTIGIPLSLYLSRNYGSWFDKLTNLLSPLSSVPSWVHGILLIMIFAVILKILPPGGMISSPIPDTRFGIILSRIKHMVLPTLAIFLSLLFQMVYTWRNYFMIYSNEDYVELAVAQGLAPRKIQNKYILRPAMPFVLTSFALTLVSFWQMATALEVVFNWDGIGRLYILSLPHFWGEAMFPGEVGLTIGIVVIFAYLLGMVVLLLDIAYAIVDPRIRLGGQQQRVRATRNKRQRLRPKASLSILSLLPLLPLVLFPPSLPRQGSPEEISSFVFGQTWGAVLVILALIAAGLIGYFLVSRTRERRSGQRTGPVGSRSSSRFRQTMREVMRFPSAAIGLSILVIMISGSLYAVIRYPYHEIGDYWHINAMKNSSYVPRTAYPEWVNYFRKDNLPETVILNSEDHPEVKHVKALENGNPDFTFTYQFEYPYLNFPTEATLYFNAHYKEKQPFATLTWTTPDGREITFSNMAIKSDQRYSLDGNMDIRQVSDHQIEYNLQDTDNLHNPLVFSLFADPEKSEPTTVQGTYTLEVKVLGFEPDTQVDTELVVLGQIYGAAGTDFYRRDLTVPLLWGMPFALVIGLFGAFLTTIVSMLFAAFGVWFGGWADNLVQRVTEANMILPVVAIAVMFYAFYGSSLWTVLTIIVVLNAFGSPTKTFRAAFLQIKDASYVEAAQAYGAPNRRIIFRYMIPRIMPVMIPQLVTLIPGFIFLEATLGMFNVKSNLPTWGKVIYEALRHGAAWGSKFWVLEPITLLLLTGFAFSMMGFALDRVLNPRLQQGD